MKSNKMPFRYDVDLERLVNQSVDEGSKYEDLEYFITAIEEFEPNLMGFSSFEMESGTIDLGQDQSGHLVKSFLDNLFINVNAGTNRDRYYILVDSFNHVVTLINQNKLPHNLKLPKNQSRNLTLYTYTRLSDQETILSNKQENVYGVHEGAFDHNDFIGLDFSIGNNITI